MSVNKIIFYSTISTLPWPVSHFCDLHFHLVTFKFLLSSLSLWTLILPYLAVSSVSQSCLTFCHPIIRSTPGLPVHHQLLKSTQTHVHWVSDAIQPSHLLSSPFPPVLNLSQHQGLSRWVSSSHEVAKVLEFQLQHQSPMNTQDWSPLGWTGWISLQSKGLSRVFSNTTVQKHQFLGTQLSL